MTNEFGRWLLGKMESEHIGVTALAARIGVSHSSVSLWLEGKRTPNSKSIAKIAKVFSSEPDDVMRLAGHLPHDPYQPDPESPPERFHAKMKHVTWNREREMLIEGILDQMLTFDRRMEDSA